MVARAPHQAFSAVAPVWICATCGCHYPEAQEAPKTCIICTDERQWVPATGQQWTILDRLKDAGHRSDIREVEPGLLGIGVQPPFAIGQRALLVVTPAGNVLWDPPGFVDKEAIQAVRDAGGLHAVTASHPHFYGAIVDWSRAFNAPILLCKADEHWLRRPASTVRTWSDSLSVLPGVTLVQCGGHFAGSAVVHWANGASGTGVLLSGDTIFVTPGEDRVSFVGSAPNRLPLSEEAVRGVVDAVRPFTFDRIYGGFWEPVLRQNARQVVENSARRYIQWLRGEAEL